MNQSVKSVVVLFSICLVVSILLSGINYLTAPIIEEQAEKTKYESLYTVFPDAVGFDDLTDKATLPESVTGIFRETTGYGYAVTLATSSQFSKSDMVFTVAIDHDGKLLAVELTNYAESKEFGKDYPQNFVGTDASTMESVDLVGGVTYSSSAFKTAVADAFAAVAAVKEVK